MSTILFATLFQLGFGAVLVALIQIKSKPTVSPRRIARRVLVSN